VIRLRRQGMKYREIAQRVGISVNYCHTVVRKEMARAAEATKGIASVMVEEAADRVEGLLNTAYPLALKGDLLAMEKALKLIQELNRLRGLYPAARSEVKVAYEQDYEALIAEARRRGMITDEPTAGG
jgi:transposase